MTLNPRLKSLLALSATLLFMTNGHAQQVNSLGIFTGIAVPYTFDAGINKDARYRIRYNVKHTPVGIHYGVDYDGYGLMIDPCLLRIGQNFNVINTLGGHIGERQINLTYLYLPAGFKLHLIDLSFFKVSLVASVGFGVLLKGDETINHKDSKINFPLSVYPELSTNPEYTSYLIEYDGVLSPNVTNRSSQSKLLSKEDFQSFQIFGGLGFRSDWDITETWRTSIDIRGNIGALEPRKSDYIDKVKANQAVYDIYGARRDLFLSVSVGLARTLEIEPKQKEAKIRKRKENKPHRPSKYPWPKPRNKKPKK